jgi:hypothetical protein
MVKITHVPFGLAGMTVGFGIMSKSFNSPGLGEAGVASGKFISPAINIGAGGYLMNQVRGFGKR